nr:oligosaccharide flippase family protein [Microbacterium barkeri]
MNSLLALGARAVTMVISLVCGVITTRMILGETDVDHYALYTLLITIPSLLTFTDLGSGAVLVNAVATSDDVRTDRKLRLQVTSVGRILLMFASALMVINTVLLVTGGWRALFGDAGAIPGAPLAAFLCITLFSLTVTLGVWFRILLGQRRNHLVILVQGLISPVTLAGVWLMLTFGGRAFDSFLAVASYAASLLTAIIGFLLVTRSTAPLIPDALRVLLRWRRVPGVRVMDVGWPMLAQMVTYPIAVGSQRYVLAQYGTPTDVAEYGVAGQVFFALNGLVMAAGVALWPQFARRRHPLRRPGESHEGDRPRQRSGARQRAASSGGDPRCSRCCSAERSPRRPRSCGSSARGSSSSSRAASSRSAPPRSSRSAA